jgi:hypothetical protein
LRVRQIFTAVAAGLLLAPDGAELVWAPTEGEEVRRSVRSVTELELVELVLEEAGTVEEREDLSISLTNERTLELLDLLEAVGDGRPALLRRSFERIETFTSGTSVTPRWRRSTEVRGRSPLEGEAVEFAWDESLGDWTVEWGGAGGPDELLDGLVEDADLRRLLPPGGDVEEGDAWDVDPAALVDVFRMGGDLAVDVRIPADAEEPEPVALGYFLCPREAAAAPEGEVVARDAGEGEYEGTRLVELELEVEDTRDVLEAIRAIGARSKGGFSDAEEFESARVELELEGTGELVWDLELGRAESLTIEAEVELALVATAPARGGGERTLRLVLSGETRYEARFTDRDGLLRHQREEPEEESGEVEGE